MYHTEYKGQAKLKLNSGRVTAQFNFIQRNIITNEAYVLGRNISVLEIGCANAYLLQRLAPWYSNVTCFEPSPILSAKAKEELMKTKNSSDWSVTVHPTNWDESQVTPESIDLFVSSHVLEHISDLCMFFTHLYSKMKPGGAVFSEVPNHTRDYVNSTFGGQFHVTLFNVRGWILMMEGVGFELMVLETTGGAESPLPNGYHIRAIFTKPGHASQTRDSKRWGGMSE
jgi:2-polyprenyl-3-methyl-5-hydroxy-6-metoxy-1,4-benzoquinol methylase